MQYSIHIPSRSFRSTYNWDLLHSSSNIHALRGSLIESINSIWQRRHSAMQYLIHVSSRSLSSTYNQDMLHSSSNIYTLSEDHLLSQSIQSGRDAILLCNIQYIYVIFNTCPLAVAQLDL
ncbi:hypothetical protein GIB67_003858 [Kingdonia uniflora]|uniref:Uncharacterized protein n=1 Tax=Kingdonia uniflora TaxID=39325 RepID=A0A7J7NY91_9MAGN|nr:hypothetical protein GIB67_003858 [Kingdonia uniflora]